MGNSLVFLQSNILAHTSKALNNLCSKIPRKKLLDSRLYTIQKEKNLQSIRVYSEKSSTQVLKKKRQCGKMSKSSLPYQLTIAFSFE